MTLGHDRFDHAGMVLDDIAGNEKRRRDLEMIEQTEQSRHADARTIFTLRHQRASHGEGGVFTQCGGLTVDVKT
jgi:hypothetical protein